MNAFLCALEKHQDTVINKLEKHERQISKLLKQKNIKDDDWLYYRKSSREKIQTLIMIIKDQVKKGHFEAYEAFWEALLETNTAETQFVMQILNENPADIQVKDNNLQTEGLKDNNLQTEGLN